jgi:RNA-binding protein YlmH
MEREELFRSRMHDLADAAYQRGIVFFSDFLDLYELHLLHGLNWRERGVKLRLSGGYDTAERQMAAFVPDALSYEWKFPVACLRITPETPKYAEKLTHRDYLGSILGLGLERGKTGDILVKPQEAWCFCHASMADFICRELHTVRHTAVTAVLCTDPDEGDFRPEEKEITGTVASVRLDSVIALAFGLPRSAAVSQIEGGRVFVNGRLITSNGFRLSEGDRISVRGLGKCRFGQVLTSTRKGREMIRVYRYI